MVLSQTSLPFLPVQEAAVVSGRVASGRTAEYSLHAGPPSGLGETAESPGASRCRPLPRTQAARRLRRAMHRTLSSPAALQCLPQTAAEHSVHRTMFQGGAFFSDHSVLSVAASLPARLPSTHAGPRMPQASQRAEALPPQHHNALYGRALTPTKSSPLAQQRMVSMEAALRAGRAEPVQQRRRQQQQAPQRGKAVAVAPATTQPARQKVARRGAQPAASDGGGSSQQASSPGRAASATTASASISFGSAGCAASTGGYACAASGDHAAADECEAGAGRLRQLEVLLLQAEAAGEHFTLAQLHAAGFSSHDVQALKQSLAWHR